jgi:hypothetical protein
MQYAPTVILLFLISTLQLSAQRPKNEFSFIYGGGGMFAQSELQGMSAGGFSMNAGGGFATFFNQHLGVHVGAKLGIRRFEINVDKFENITRELADVEGHFFELHSTLFNYTESQAAWFFSVPVMLQFQQNTSCFFTGNKHGFYAKGGINMLFLNSTTYSANIAELHNAGFYPQFGNWLTTQKFAGFGTFNDRVANGSFNLGFCAMLAFEMGMKWRVSDCIFLYTGAFFNYGLNDPARNQRKPFSDNIIATDDLTNFTSLLTFTDKINPITAGLTLRLAFIRSATPRIKSAPAERNVRMIDSSGRVLENRR